MQLGQSLSHLQANGYQMQIHRAPAERGLCRAIVSHPHAHKRAYFGQTFGEAINKAITDHAAIISASAI